MSTNTHQLDGIDPGAGVCGTMPVHISLMPCPAAALVTHEQDLFELVDAHFAVRELLAMSEAELEQRELQFRSVQKLLLVRYKVGWGTQFFGHVDGQTHLIAR
jgi:hypothetical protein